jgi:hypothetical protein
MSTAVTQGTVLIPLGNVREISSLSVATPRERPAEEPLAMGQKENAALQPTPPPQEVNARQMNTRCADDLDDDFAVVCPCEVRLLCWVHRSEQSRRCQC